MALYRCKTGNKSHTMHILIHCAGSDSFRREFYATRPRDSLASRVQNHVSSKDTALLILDMQRQIGTLYSNVSPSAQRVKDRPTLTVCLTDMASPSDGLISWKWNE